MLSLLFFEREILYKELVHAIMEAGKSQIFQGELASSISRRADDLVSV